MHLIRVHVLHAGAQDVDDEAAPGAAASDLSIPEPLPTVKDDVQREVLGFYKTGFDLRRASRASSTTLRWHDSFWGGPTNNKTRFPNMWMLARTILSTPASTVPVESLFAPS